MFEKLTYAGNRENIAKLSADRVAARADSDGGVSGHDLSNKFDPR